MRIALVTHYFPAHRGGIELVAGELAKRLAESHGAEISWHASDTDPPPQLAGVACVPASAWNGLERALGVPYPVWSPSAFWRLAATVRAADAVHLHDCLYLPNLVAYAVARLARRPVLVTQHVAMVPYRNPVLRALLFLAYRSLARIVLGGATRVAFVSDAVRRYFSFVHFQAPPELVPNGVDHAVFHPVADPRRAQLRSQLGAGPDMPLLLFVGRFVEKKGLLLLRELAERLRRVRWVFAGWGPLDPEAWRLPNVRVARDRAGRQLAPLYQAADLLVLPSVGEGFPLVVQEAMACGTPALVSDATAAGLPEAGPLLLAEPLDAERWTARIAALAGSDELAALRPRVEAFAREQWSWERCSGRYAGLLGLARDIRST